MYTYTYTNINACTRMYVCRLGLPHLARVRWPVVGAQGRHTRLCQGQGDTRQHWVVPLRRTVPRRMAAQKEGPVQRRDTGPHTLAEHAASLDGCPLPQILNLDAKTALHT